ncbi:MAG TPA: SET domain-containing protein [Chitinophagaceae bacterium]|nr:SET domain-containing protein [Chitinophagaceae bacterium]
MALLEKDLIVKTSKVPGAGKGLFTLKLIPKGSRIVEYKGKITTWKEVDHKKGNNGYIYYVNRNYVIDARSHPKALARYANDARGMKRIRGLGNNAEYVEDGLKVFIESKKDIPAGSEILVSYGKEYWDSIRYNQSLDNKKDKKKAKKAGNSRVKKNTRANPTRKYN